MLEVAALMTVCNRKESVLSFIDNFLRQVDGMKAEGQYHFSLWLLDEGSSDGLSEEISLRYPAVHLLQSGSRLYWNQGMRKVWSAAAQAQKKADFYLWLSDEVRLNDGALASIMETSSFLKHRAIVVGTVAGSDGVLYYGGRTKANKIVRPDQIIPVPCYTFNGKIVLIPEYVYRHAGLLDEHYQHGFGDFDYGVRSADLGISRAVAAGVLGLCNPPESVPLWRNSAYSLSERFSFLISPLGRPPREQFRLDYRSGGLFWAISHGISVLFRMLFPKNAS